MLACVPRGFGKSHKASVHERPQACCSKNMLQIGSARGIFATRYGIPQRLLGCILLQERCSSTGWHVSSHGRVKTRGGNVSYGTLTGAGYRAVSIGKKLFLVHRLVAAAFLDPPSDPSCWQVNHTDNDRANNHVTNLQYVSNAENQKHSHCTNPSRRKGGAKGRAVLWRPCGEEAWTRCDSQAEAARLLGVWQAAVSLCCRGVMRRSLANGVWYEFKSAPTLDLPREIWQPARYPGVPRPITNLMVSSLGRVSQTKRHFDDASWGTRMADGYHLVVREARGFLVHRLVAATFLGEPNSLDCQVNHKDRDRGNNHMENLEYVTPSENIRHALLQRTPKSRNRKPVQGRFLGDQKLWLEFESLKAAAAYTGLNPRTISRICRELDSGSSVPWQFRFSSKEQLPGEEWRPVVLEGAKRPGCGFTLVA